MNAIAQKTLFTALALAALTLGSRVEARDRSVPQLGFNSYFNGFGERVTGVNWGSRAARMGLESGDIIVSVNGYRLNYDGAWYPAIQRAANQGFVRLVIRDVRTGNFITRTRGLYNNSYPFPSAKGERED